VLAAEAVLAGAGELGICEGIAYRTVDARGGVAPVNAGLAVTVVHRHARVTVCLACEALDTLTVVVIGRDERLVCITQVMQRVAMHIRAVVVFVAGAPILARVGCALLDVVIAVVRIEAALTLTLVLGASDLRANTTILARVRVALVDV